MPGVFRCVVLWGVQAGAAYTGRGREPGRPRTRYFPQETRGRTILEPERNLGFGVRIVENQIVRQGKPLVSRSSYFSTLQPGTVSYRVFRKQMANVPEACGVGALKPGLNTPAGRGGGSAVVFNRACKRLA